MGSRTHPTYCPGCGEVDDWGDFGPDGWDGDSACVCPAVTESLRQRKGSAIGRVRGHAHEAVQAGVSTYAGCALSDVVHIVSNKPGDTALLVAAITLLLKVTANAKR